VLTLIKILINDNSKTIEIVLDKYINKMALRDFIKGYHLVFVFIFSIEHLILVPFEILNQKFTTFRENYIVKWIIT
jgi:hypothetical protein